MLNHDQRQILKEKHVFISAGLYLYEELINLLVLAVGCLLVFLLCSKLLPLALTYYQATGMSILEAVPFVLLAPLVLFFVWYHTVPIVLAPFVWGLALIHTVIEKKVFYA